MPGVSQSWGDSADSCGQELEEQEPQPASPCPDAESTVVASSFQHQKIKPILPRDLIYDQNLQNRFQIKSPILPAAPRPQPAFLEQTQAVNTVCQVPGPAACKPFRSPWD